MKKHWECPKGHCLKKPLTLTVPYEADLDAQKVAGEYCLTCYMEFIAANVPRVWFVDKR